MKYIRFLCCFITLSCFVLWNKLEVAAKDIVVVIDPGHGGENLGADYDGHLEKDMTLSVANAMYDELQKYEGIKVYMTRTSDTGISIQKRAEFAKSVDADFLFCLHFNMSLSHDLFGAEVWLSAFGDCYNKAYPFAELEMKELTSYGLHDRGIKTKLNDKGKDYYGIIRESTNLGIPSVIIEHAHLDHENDAKYVDEDTDLAYFGVLDATAVAKYFGLSSEKLGVDYSADIIQYPEASNKVMKPDTTPPDVVILSATEETNERNQMLVNITAQDYDSDICYYAFSIDGGETFGPRLAFPKEETITVPVELWKLGDVDLSVVVFNQYDLFTSSNSIPITYRPRAKQEDDSRQEAMNSFSDEDMSYDKEKDSKIDDTIDNIYDLVEFEGEKQEVLSKDQIVIEGYHTGHNFTTLEKITIGTVALACPMILILSGRILILKYNRKKKFSHKRPKGK